MRYEPLVFRIMTAVKLVSVLPPKNLKLQVQVPNASRTSLMTAWPNAENEK